VDKVTIFSLCALLLFFCLETLVPFKSGRKKRFFHAFVNIFFGSLNGAITTFILGGLTLVVLELSGVHATGFLGKINPNSFISLLVGFILLDFWMYIWHRANHTIGFLWRFHRMHHTDAQMDATSALRFHPIEIVISSILYLGIILSFGLSFTHLIVYKLVFNVNVFFHHSNIYLPKRFDRLMSIFVVSPNMHRVHHSDVSLETNSNYASVFSFWDRIFGSFKKREDTISIVYGLKGMKEERWMTLKGMLLTPLMKIIPK
jgi:sterol desaturase/sphingolipid hydroxylase (fatty acid hydroxylase superfamily)